MWNIKIKKYLVCRLFLKPLDVDLKYTHSIWHGLLTQTTIITQCVIVTPRHCKLEHNSGRWPRGTGLHGLPGICVSLQECRDTRVLIVCPWPRLAAHNTPILCYGVSGETSWPWWYILKQFLSRRYFLWNTIPCAVEPSAIWGQRQLPGGTVAQVFLCAVLRVLHHLQTLGSRSEPLQGFGKADPHGSLDPALNPPAFYLLAEAAVCSITAWHRSRFCQASRLESHLPVLGQPARLFRFGTAAVLSPDGCMAASVCFASVSPRRLSAWAQLFQAKLTPAN